MTDRRHALAFNALGSAINATGHWLPFTARRAAVDAVLAAVDAEDQAARTAARQTTGQDDTEPTTADDPVPLRWGLGDVFHNDDDTTIVCFSGPDREPYALHLEPEQRDALRDDLTPADDEQPAEAHDTDTSTWWTIQAQKPTGTWFNLSEGFSSAEEARAWRDTEITEPRNWPLRIVRVDQTETVAVEDER